MKYIRFFLYICVNFTVLVNQVELQVAHDLSYKKLKEVPQNIPKNTTYINMGYNQLKTLKHGFFKDLGQVTWIALNSNKIAKIEKGAFLGLPRNLWTLILSKNKLETLNAEMWMGIKKNGYLIISQNEIRFISLNCFGPNLLVTRQLDLHGNRIVQVTPETLAT